MTEQEVSVRLTENDERLYACAKRLEAVERRQDALDKLVTAVEVLAVRQESVEGNVKEIRNAVQSITEKPGTLALAGPAPSRGPSGPPRPLPPCRWNALSWKPTAPIWPRSLSAAPAATAPSSAMWASISPASRVRNRSRCSARR